MNTKQLEEWRKDFRAKYSHFYIADKGNPYAYESSDIEQDIERLLASQREEIASMIEENQIKLGDTPTSHTEYEIRARKLGFNSGLLLASKSVREYGN